MFNIVLEQYLIPAMLERKPDADKKFIRKTCREIYKPYHAKKHFLAGIEAVKTWCENYQ